MFGKASRTNWIKTGAKVWTDVLLSDFQRLISVIYAEGSRAGVNPSLTWQDDEKPGPVNEVLVSLCDFLFTRPGWLVIGRREPKTNQTGQSQLFHSGADQKAN